MTWGRLDDGFDGHRKRRQGSLAADGLLARAIGHAAKHETDGFVDAGWLKQQGSPNERRRALRDALKARLLERFEAGDVREIEAPARRGVRNRARVVVVGPFEEDGYLVHDFLDFNPARVDLAEKRAKERGKKREERGKPKLWDGSYADDVPRGSPPGCPPLKGDTGKGSSSVPPEHVNGERPQSHAPALEHVEKVRRIVAIFAELGVTIDEPSVSNAISRFPNRDHEQVARGCAEACRSDRTKPPGLTYHRWLEREEPQRAGRSKAEREADDLAAIARLTGRA